MIKYLLIAAFALLSACAGSAQPPSNHQCFDSPPGREGIPPDSDDAVRLIRVELSVSGAVGYIATEYIGAQNLQSSMYIYRSGKYCTAGDLGPFTGYSIDKTSTGDDGYFDVIIKSRSGGVEFIRGFKFRRGAYTRDWCKTTGVGENLCMPND